MLLPGDASLVAFRVVYHNSSSLRKQATTKKELHRSLQVRNLNKSEVTIIEKSENLLHVIWEKQGALIWTPNSRVDRIGTATKRTPQFIETATSLYGN